MGPTLTKTESELEMCVEAIEVVPDYTEGVFYYEDDIPEDLRDAARQVERNRMKQFHVKDDLLEKDYDQRVHGKIITARWQEVRRSENLVRSRIVAREYAVYAEPNLFAGAPDTLALRRFLLSVAFKNKDFVIIVLDATSAFYQAPIVVPTVVRPPHGEAASGILWKLNKAMPGLRASAKAWGKRKADVYIEVGCE